MPDNTQNVEVKESRGSWKLPRDLDSTDFWRALALYLIHKTTDSGFALVRLDELASGWQCELLLGLAQSTEFLVLRNVQRVERPPSRLEEMPAAGGVQ